MEARAVWRFARISPRKVRLVADAIRGKDVNTAVNIVKFTNKKAARMMEKVIKSAITNVESKSQAEASVNEMIIKEIFVDKGPVLKRFRPRALGRANRILKRTSHITVVVGDNQAAS